MIFLHVSSTILLNLVTEPKAEEHRSLVATKVNPALQEQKLSIVLKW